MTTKLIFIAFSSLISIKSFCQVDTLKVHTLQEVVVIGIKTLDKLSETIIDSTTINHFGWHQPYDIFSIAPGVLRRGRDIIIRGGNRNDIDWQIEGISVRDPQTSGYITSTNMNAISNIKISPGGLIANTGNAKGAIVDITLKEPQNDHIDASLSMGTFNTRLIEGSLSRNIGKLKILFSNSLMTSDALMLDNRVPSDYNPYTRVLNSNNVFPTEQNKGLRLNVTTKAIYQINDKSRLSFFINHSIEEAENPPLFHNGANFSQNDIQSLIASNKIDNADYSLYPTNRLWGGRIHSSGTLFSSKIEKIINNGSFINIQPFIYHTYKYRKDHDGSWFFEQGFGGGYENTRNNYQYGIKGSYFNKLNKWYSLNLLTEYRLTDMNYKGKMTPTVLDTYGNIRRNFYSEPYTLAATENPASPYYNWPDPNAVIDPMSEKYDGNYYYFVTLFNNTFQIKDYLVFNLGMKNTTTNIGKNVSILDPFATLKIDFLKNLTFSTSYSHSTQITSIYQAYSNPYNPYTYGYDATFDAEGNPNIRPERAKTYELGLSYKTEKVLFSVNYYKRETKDDILPNYAPQIVPSNIDINIAKHYMQYQNLGFGKASGVELKIVANLPYNFRISVFGNLLADSKTKSSGANEYESTRYNQRNTLNVLIFHKSKKMISQLHIEYGSGLPYRWREMGTDVNGNQVQIKRHNYDRNVDAHIVFNSTFSYTVSSKFSVQLGLTNIQGLLNPIFHWGANQYVEYRDTDSVQHPLGIPRYAYNSFARINLGIRYGF